MHEYEIHNTPYPFGNEYTLFNLDWLIDCTVFADLIIEFAMIYEMTTTFTKKSFFLLLFCFKTVVCVNNLGAGR